MAVVVVSKVEGAATSDKATAISQPTVAATSIQIQPALWASARIIPALQAEFIIYG